MVNIEIFEGLKQAVSRGQSLRDAMMSFYNAGYKKEEIEDAARAIVAQSGAQLGGVQSVKNPPSSIQAVKPVQNKPIPAQQKITPNNSPATPGKLIHEENFLSKNKENLNIKSGPVIVQSEPSKFVSQKISDYSFAEKKSSGYSLVIFISVILFILIGVLVSAILFKDQVINFFNKLL